MSTLAEARALLESGRPAEAQLACRELLDAHPDDNEALSLMGQAALRQGQVQVAIDSLQQASARAPADATSRQHLGRALELAADYRSAANAYQEALHLDGTLFTARLHLGGVLERLQEPETAVIHYRRALDDAQAQGQWLDQSNTPPLLRPLVKHAVLSVRRGCHAAFERLFAPLRERYGPQSLDRVEQCVRIFLNEERAVYPDPRQRPSFLFFPGLPTSAYFDVRRIPWVKEVESNTDAVMAELLQLLPETTGREAVYPDKEAEDRNLRGGLEVPPSWNGYYFYRHGLRREDNCARCPNTARMLDSLPLCRVREHGPEVMYSVFTAGTHLLAHRGVTNTRSVAHLALMVPAQCALSVGGETYEWRTGRVVVFDDTYEHEAWNRSDKTRVVLIFDIWNPFLTEAERAAVTDLVGAIGDMRKAVTAA